MPNIREFSAPEGLGLAPTDRGTEATAAAARRIGTSYREIADAKSDLGSRIGSTIRDVGDIAVKYEDHQQISAGAAHGAELFDGLTKSKDEAIKAIDPNDPAYGQKVETALKGWREQTLEPALDKFRDGFTTENSQAWAERFAENTRNHMFVSTAADMSTAAGIGIRNSVRTVANVASNTALNDPSSVPAQLDLVEHSVNGMVDSSPIRGTAGAEVKSEVLERTKEQIVKAGAIGAIQKSNDPEKTAQEWVAKYPQYINGAEAVTLAGNARQQIRARNYDFETDRKRTKEVAQDKSTEVSNQYLIDVRSRDPRIAGDPTAVKILNDTNLTKTDKNNLLNYVDRTLKPETDSRLSQQTFVGLLRDLRAPNSDADAVMQKAWDARLLDPGKPGSMTEHDFQQFRQEVVGRKTPEGAALERDRGQFFKQYAGTIAGPSYSAAVGDPKLYNAEVDARRMEGFLKQKGLDPHLAYDPASEYFLGRPERLGKWQQSMQMDLQTRVEGPAAATATRPEVPFDLRGIADVSYNRSKNLWRDNTSGKIYDASGKEAGK
jgi:hypothetical protein